MKAKECVKKGIRLVQIGIKKATSYNVVKNRLNYRFYNDEFLQDRLEHQKQSTATKAE